MEDGYSFSRKNNGVLWRSLRDGDFEEEDVWAVLKESKDSTLKVGQSIEPSKIAVTRHLPSAARMIPRSLSATGYVGGCCSGSTTHYEAKSNVVKQQQQSAPVSIPDWSKVSANTRNGSWHDDDDDGDGYGYDDEYNTTKFPPPHEIIAKRLAGSQISSFSMFEGVGRKLKGRDLRKVRNAVLTRTGFLE